MSEVRKVDTNLATIIHTMKLKPEKDSIVMVDVETNNPQASSFKKLRIFDFAYGAFNPFSGVVGDVKSNLVYEGMLNPKVLEQIIEWKKIRHASFDSYYGLFNLLVQQDWWSDRVFPKEEVTEEAIVKFKQSARERLYNVQTRLLPEQRRILEGWETVRSHHKDASKHAAGRRADIKKSTQAIKDLTEWLAAGEQLDKTIKGGGLLGNPTYDSVMEDVYTDLYSDQYERINWEGDMAFFQEVERLTGANFSQDVKRWGDVITTFDQDLKHNKNLLGITAYNISHEQNAIKAMVSDFGPSEQYGKILDGDRYNSICMNNMMGLISKQEAKDVINSLHTFDDKFFVEQVAKAFKETGKLNTQTFELFYQNTFPAEKYEQSHTGKGDVLDQTKAFVQAFQTHIAPLLEKRR